MHRYFVAEEYSEDTDAFISDPPQNFDSEYLLFEGVSLVDQWPDDVTVQFSKGRLEGVNLTDALHSVHGFNIVSGAMKAVLESAADSHVEFLPLRVLNHKGRLASEAYWAVNVLTHIAAVDRDRSVYDVHAFYEDQIDSFERLALQEEILKECPPLFRLKERPRLLLMHEDLVQTIRTQGLTGLRFTPADDYSSI